MSELHTFGRPRSNLHQANNDTGRDAFCGPYVLSAITGHPISTLENAISAYREIPSNKRPPVKGTYASELEATLSQFGFSMSLKESFLHLERKRRPNVWSWMQKPRNAWSHYILAIHKGSKGHWILIKGVMMSDTYTEGQWKFVCDGPHRCSRIMEIFEVQRKVFA